MYLSSVKEFAIILTLLISVSVFAAADAFSVLDTNSDNSLSREEASSLPGLMKNWVKLDINEDNRLSNNEFQSYARYSGATAAPDIEPQKQEMN